MKDEKKIWHSISLKRFFRKLKTKERKHRQRGGKPRYQKFKYKPLGAFDIIAPAILSMTKGIDYRFASFTQQLENKSRLAFEQHRVLRINFRDTEVIDASACIVLIAMLDMIKYTYPKLKIKAVRPKSKPHDNRKHSPYDVDAVFCHIGLYKLLGHNYTSHSLPENVKCWHYIFSDSPNGQITQPLLKELSAMGINTKGIYSSYIEAIANAVEHAYSDKIPSQRKFPLKRWWMLLAVIKGKLSLFVCDLGHGIPNTLDITQVPSLLQKVWKLLKSMLREDKVSDDSSYIKAATMIKETRTSLDYRGKGGVDIRSFIDKTPNSKLIIRSNKGAYIYLGKDKPDFLQESKYSMNGTVIQWIIPINEKTL